MSIVFTSTDVDFSDYRHRLIAQLDESFYEDSVQGVVQIQDPSVDNF